MSHPQAGGSALSCFAVSPDLPSPSPEEGAQKFCAIDLELEGNLKLL